MRSTDWGGRGPGLVELREGGRCGAALAGTSHAVSGKFWGSSRARLAAGQSRYHDYIRPMASSRCSKNIIKDDACPVATWRGGEEHSLRSASSVAFPLHCCSPYRQGFYSCLHHPTYLHTHTPATFKTSTTTYNQSVCPSASALALALAFGLPSDNVYTIALFRFPRPGTVERAVAFCPIASAVVIRAAIQLKVSWRHHCWPEAPRIAVDPCYTQKLPLLLLLRPLAQILVQVH